MARTPSARTVLKTLRNAGFAMDAIVDQGKGRIEIGYLTDGRVQCADRDRTDQAATVAEELLGWGAYRTGYGTYWLEVSYDYNDATRELIRQNID